MPRRIGTVCNILPKGMDRGEGSGAQAIFRDWAKPLIFFWFSRVLFRNQGFNIEWSGDLDGRARAR